jgi:hypothetical protein
MRLRSRQTAACAGVTSLEDASADDIAALEAALAASKRCALPADSSEARQARAAIQINPTPHTPQRGFSSNQFNPT